MPISTLDRDKVSAFGTKGTHEIENVGIRKDNRNGSAARAERSLKPMRFVSLHHHSTFSYLDGFQLPEVHARRAAELNMQAIAMTEHGNISSHVKLEKACRDEKDDHKRPNPAFGMKPIFGCELYTGKVGKEATQKKYHLTVIAKDLEGYRNLLKLVSLSYAEGFYHEPTVSWQMLKRYRKGLVVLSGCQGSLLFCSVVGGKLIEESDASYRRGLEVARAFQGVFGDNYFVEVQAFPELDKTRRANPILARIAHKLGIRLVATMDCHYTVPTEQEIQKVLHNVRPGERRTLEDMERQWGYTVPLCPPKTDMSIYNRLRKTGLSKEEAVQAVVSTEEIAQECDVVLPRQPELEYGPPVGFKDPIEYWRHLLKEGWKFRGYHRMKGSQIAKAKRMLRKEMDVIESKDFVDYLLVVRDGIVFAKDYRGADFPTGIPVGPARGSAAASIACYLLRITEVNPMLFPELVFERFIDISRADPPDIDTDFASEGRSLVRQFYVEKYGEECVNNIGTFTYYKSRLALDDVAKVHKIPKWEVEKVKELLVERSSGDLRASATIEDTIEQFDAAAAVAKEHPEILKATELEGNVKQFGVHAAGLVISNGDIRDVCAVYERIVNDQLYQVVSMDKYDAERQGLLKLDFLGLSTLDIIAECMHQIDLPLTALYDIPLDDEDTAKGFMANDVVGIFQLEGRAARSVNGALRAENFKEVCDVGALCRPGPLHNGASNEYIDIKRGISKPELVHPALEDITRTTHYQIVYQEQILRIVRTIGNFDWTHASHIRRIISKKHGQAEFNREWERYWTGAQTLHKRTDYPPMDEETARKIWGWCITAGSYAFNVAHSISYGMLAWWMMWFKQHHTAAFYAASLSKRGDGAGIMGSGQKTASTSKIDTGRHATIIRDATRGMDPIRKPINVKPPHPVRSNSTWTRTAKGTIRAGFEQIDGIGPSKAEAIIDFRSQANGDFKGWDDLIKIKGFGPKTLEKIKDWVTQEDPFGVTTLDNLMQDIKDNIADGNLDLPYPTHNAAQVPYERGQNVQVIWMGMILNRNLRDLFETNRARKGVELDPSEVRSPDLREWVIMGGYDGEEILSLRIDRFRYPKFRKLVWDIQLGDDIILAQGVKPGNRTARVIDISKLWRIRT